MRPLRHLWKWYRARVGSGVLAFVTVVAVAGGVLSQQTGTPREGEAIGSRQETERELTPASTGTAGDLGEPSPTGVPSVESALGDPLPVAVPVSWPIRDRLVVRLEEIYGHDSSSASILRSEGTIAMTILKSEGTIARGSVVSEFKDEIVIDKGPCAEKFLSFTKPFEKTKLFSVICKGKKVDYVQVRKK